MTPCWWRESEPRAGTPATPWRRGQLLQIVFTSNDYRAMVATMDGYIKPCYIGNVIVASSDALQIRWRERCDPY